MKKRLAAAVLAVLMLASCTGAPAQTADPTAPSAENARGGETENTSGTAETVISPEFEQVMPIIYINSESGSSDFVDLPVNGYVSSQIASWTPGYVRPPEPYYEKCGITLTDTDGSVLLDNVGAKVKVRGNWTTSYPKKPLRIKFDEKQSMVGLNGGAEQKNWVLLASYKDLSLLRDQTALMLADGLLGADGLYSSDCRQVEVFVNNEYRGVYLLAEQQQTGRSRVNVTEPKKDYTGTDIGYFMEYDGYFKNEDRLQRFRLDFADNAPVRAFDGNNGERAITLRGGDAQEVGITIKSDIYSESQRDFIASYVNNIYRVMYEAAYHDKALTFSDDLSELYESPSLTPEQAVRAVVDVNSLADMYILSEITCDADIYWSSFFMSADLGANGDGKLRFEAPWDFDSSLGNKDRCADGKGFYAANIVYDVNNVYETINPWLAVLMYEPWFTDIIREKWTVAYDSGLFDRAYELIEDSSALQAAYERNFARWDYRRNKADVESELSPRSRACKNQAGSAAQLLEWLKTRVEFLNGYWHK